MRKKQKRRGQDSPLIDTFCSFSPLHHAEPGSIRRLCRDTAPVHATSVLLESLSGLLVVLFRKCPKAFRGCAGTRPYSRMHVVPEEKQKSREIISIFFSKEINRD